MTQANQVSVTLFDIVLNCEANYKLISLIVKVIDIIVCSWFHSFYQRVC